MPFISSVASQAVLEGIKRLQEEYGDKVFKIITVDMAASVRISVGWSECVPQRSTSPIRIVLGSVYRMSHTMVCTGTIVTHTSYPPLTY